MTGRPEAEGPALASRGGNAAVWQDVELSGYAADLPLWEELAKGVRGPILELGSGIGRVALRLARGGAEVWAVDEDPAVLSALEAEAGDAKLPVHAVLADVRTFSLARRFDLILMPMALVQLLDRGAREDMLSRLRAHLLPAGAAAIAVLDEAAQAARGSGSPLPDVREKEGWIYSSLPIEVRRDGEDLEVVRLRQTVSPAGELDDEVHITRLALLTPDELESEASAVGLRPLARRPIPPTASHMGSVVVLLGGRR